MVKEPYTMRNKVTNEIQIHIDETDPDRFYYMSAQGLVVISKYIACLENIAVAVEEMAENLAEELQRINRNEN